MKYKGQALKRTTRVNKKSYADIIQCYYESIGTPKALALWLLFKYNEHDQLLGLEARPHDYVDRLSFHKDYLAVKFLSKFDGLETSFDKTATAIEAFKSSEVRCRETNARVHDFPHRCDTGVASVIYRCREKMRSVMGKCNSETLEKIFGLSGFGPGVTTTVKGKWLSPLRKIGDASPGVTKTLDAVLSLSLTASDYPSWDGLHKRSRTPGNTVTCVPKNSKTHRTIAIEPGVNSYFQKGVGSYLKGRIKRRMGIDLSDQTVNQVFARQGSVDGYIATIDLQAASDTISSEVVNLLVPESWRFFLEALRSPMYYLDGKWYPYEKHSSMGNGYTFELETLIFAAVTSSVCDVLDIAWEGTCYGDDIIVPCSAVTLLHDVLAYLGFTVNTEKSFWETPFRESCGSDWYDGVEVTPFYLKRASDNVQVQVLANWLRVKAPEWMSITHTWACCYSYLPRAFRFYIPADLDGGLVVNEWEWDPTYALRRRPYGPVIGVKVKLTSFQGTTRVPYESESQPAPDSYLSACLYSLDKMASNVIFSLYERREAARSMGRWRTRTTIYTKEWPIVRSV